MTDPASEPARPAYFISNRTLKGILADYQSEMSVIDIATKWHVSPAQVSTLAKKHNLQLRHRRLTPETKAAIIAAYVAKVPIAEISKRFGVNHNTPSNLAIRAGIRRTKKRTRR